MVKLTYFIGIVAYYILDDLLTYYYKKNNNEKSNIENYNVVELIHLFMFFSYLIFLFISLYRKYKNPHILFISFIFIKYSTIFYFYPQIQQEHYVKRRTLMWLFATYSMLDLYTVVNKINFIDIKPYFHLIPNLGLLLCDHLTTHYYFQFFYLISILSQIYFIYNLNYNFRSLKYTQLYIYFWILFGILYSLTYFNILNFTQSNILIAIGDLMVKLTAIIIIYDNEEQRLDIASNMDLQSITLLNNIFNTIHDFKDNNSKISKNCENTLKYITELIKDIYYSKESNNIVKIELLKKILPYDLDDKYLLSNIKKYNKHNNICILFTDIVSYSEYSKNHKEEDVYKLLNEMYMRFDFILRKYKNLQKIETIGDSYMLVSNLYENDLTSEYLNEIIMIAFEFMDSVKYLKINKDYIPQIRIGIHCGPVISGLLGLDIPRLCIVGNTVNFTARLQTTSEPNKIHISKEIYEYIKDDERFEFEEKKNTYLKNIGNIDTYFIEFKNKKHTSSISEK